VTRVNELRCSAASSNPVAVQKATYHTESIGQVRSGQVVACPNSEDRCVAVPLWQRLIACLHRSAGG